VLRQRHDHDCDHQCRPDRPEQPKGGEQSAGELGRSSDGRQRAPWTEPDGLEVAGGTCQPMSTEPTEELLRSVRGHGRAEDHAGHEQAKAHHCEAREFVHTSSSWKLPGVIAGARAGQPNRRRSLAV
jgi:hypothetical protein